VGQGKIELWLGKVRVGRPVFATETSLGKVMALLGKCIGAPEFEPETIGVNVELTADPPVTDPPDVDFAAFGCGALAVEVEAWWA
jgi:hypothetical protein